MLTQIKIIIISSNNSLLDELAISGVKYNPEDVITVLKLQMVNLYRLEKKRQ